MPLHSYTATTSRCQVSRPRRKYSYFAQAVLELVLAPAPDCSAGHSVVGAGSRTEELHTLTSWSQSSDTCWRHAETRQPA